MKSENIIRTEVLVIGSGIAGCATTLELADRKIPVALITDAKKIEESNTKYAQGGIVYRGENDPGLLIEDTLRAGAGLCDPKAVKILAQDGPTAIENILIKKLNIQFSKDKKGNFHLTKEAGHSCRRILHIKDQTGKAIEEAFIKKIKHHPYIKVYPDHTLIDLLTFQHHLNKKIPGYRNFSQSEKITCVGAYVLDNQRDKVKSFIAKKIVLATGGVGQLFLRTVNSKIARGDGLAAAERAGAKIVNAEFIQFHPTSFFHRDLSNFLISEAVRGEGAQLKNKKGKLFMKKYDQRGSLAPRDIVTRGIFEEMLKTNEDHVFLDIFSYLPAKKIKSSFPNIYRTCLQYGIDITREPIPVVPTTHYFCGGVKVDEWGQTSISNLFAVGEVSCTGVHGANRLASNSLLECLVWAKRCAKHILLDINNSRLIDPRLILPWKYTHKIKRFDPALIQQDWLLVKSIMWNYVGIVRTKNRLQRAVKDLSYLQKEVEEFYRNLFICDELVGLRNGIQAALIIAKASLKNNHSQGCHFIKRDYF